MPGIIVGTNLVSLDEPCYMLIEVDEVSPITHQWHRFRIFKLVRNDEVVEFRQDMGPRVDTEGFVIIGGWTEHGKLYIEETVGRLLEMADDYRAKLHEGKQIEPRDLVEGYHAYYSSLKMGTKSTFGPRGRVVRG